MRIGFIGLGRMGKPMAYNLLRGGYDLTVLNRSKTPEEALVNAGALKGATPLTMGRDLDAVLTCLPNVAAVKSVLTGPVGVLTEASPGLILVDHSTIDPATSRFIARNAQKKGAIFLDAPISGGVEGARAGSLTIMVGGNKEAYATIFPLLQSMGHTIRHLGPNGAGSVAKLVNQLLTSIHSTATLEALALAKKAGADTTVLNELIQASYGSSRMWERNVPRVIKNHFPPDAPIRLLDKDQGLINVLAQDLGLNLPVFQAAREFWSGALRLGLAEEDIAAAIKMFEE